MTRVLIVVIPFIKKMEGFLQYIEWLPGVKPSYGMAHLGQLVHDADHWLLKEHQLTT